MIIKNGFIKDITGNWLNINFVILFMIEKQSTGKFRIDAIFDNSGKTYNIISQNHKSKEEAQKILDQCFE